MAPDEAELFGTLLARLLEDGLSGHVETGLFLRCLAVAREPTIRALRRRIDEEHAANIPARRGVLHHLEHLARYLEADLA